MTEERKMFRDVFNLLNKHYYNMDIKELAKDLDEINSKYEPSEACRLLFWLIFAVLEYLEAKNAYKLRSLFHDKKE